MSLSVVEICAGAGGQALGLEDAGFEHELAVELDTQAVQTLRENRPSWKIAEGDVADPKVWDPAAYHGVDLIAGGVPCPPFTVAGRQLGAADERDLFAWAIELARVIKPRALLLENVRGLSMPRFSGYRQHVLDRLTELGFVATWRLLHAADFGVPQLRPRFVLVALRPDDAQYFAWPEPDVAPLSVGETLLADMAEQGWEGAATWAQQANSIAPTIVGGSKKHGGADLGPTRAKKAWATLGVDAMGVADHPPQAGDYFPIGPKLTTEMVAKIQGWNDAYPWRFTGRKTSRYRQIGNAFPPPVAKAIGTSVLRALEHLPIVRSADEAHDSGTHTDHDIVYRILRDAQTFLTERQIATLAGSPYTESEIARRLGALQADFEIETREDSAVISYKLAQFKAFTGQTDHSRHSAFAAQRGRIS